MIAITVIAKGLCHRVWAGLGLETAWAIIKIYVGSQLISSNMGSIRDQFGDHNVSQDYGRTEFGLGIKSSSD